jgi:hypothetical protein
MSAYCVFLCRTRRKFSRAKKHVISADTAMLALRAVAEKYPQYQPIGVEPGSLGLTA